MPVDLLMGSTPDDQIFSFSFISTVIKKESQSDIQILNLFYVQILNQFSMSTDSPEPDFNN